MSSPKEFESHGNYSMTAKGLFINIPAKGEEKAKQEKICGAFEILGISRDVDSKQWGKYLRWFDPDGNSHVKLISDAALQGDPANICASLADEGLAVTNKSHQKNLVTYLIGAQTYKRARIVSSTGWHEINGRLVFVLPNESIGSDSKEEIILEGGRSAPYEAKGSLDSWQGSVCALAAEHNLAIVAISAALAGPLLYLVNMEGGGINFFGPSSQGKSTLLQTAASVWGRGGAPGFVRAWRATSNGLESVAALSSDSCLILDELGAMDARDAASGIYSLGNGTGKSRSGRNGDLIKPKSWRIVLLSSGELPVSSKLNEDKTRKAMAGQMVRLLDIPCDAGKGFGAFDHGNEQGDAAPIAKQFKQASVQYYGTAGPAFLKALIKGEIEPSEIRKLIEIFTDQVRPDQSDGQTDRAIQRFGLLCAAGMLAAELGIVTWTPDRAFEAIKSTFYSWLSNRGGCEPFEVTQAVQCVRLAIEQHGHSRFERLDGGLTSTLVHHRLGWTEGSGDEQTWLIPPESWKEICSGNDFKLVAKILADRGMILKANDGYQTVKKIHGTAKRVYVVTPNIFEA
jgi:uncharacterized protein (DUF927 family)